MVDARKRAISQERRRRGDVGNVPPQSFGTDAHFAPSRICASINAHWAPSLNRLTQRSDLEHLAAPVSSPEDAEIQSVSRDILSATWRFNSCSVHSRCCALAVWRIESRLAVHKSKAILRRSVGVLARRIAAISSLRTSSVNFRGGVGSILRPPGTVSDALIETKYSLHHKAVGRRKRTR